MLAPERTSWPWEAVLSAHPAEPVATAFGTITCRRAGSGADVVLLHGIGSGSGSWAYQLDALAGAYRLAAWDAPGYGGSDPVAAPTADAYADALAALLDALSIERPVLVGNSLGALMAAQFARRRPDRVRALVLADPAQGHARLSPDERAERRAGRLDPFQTLGADGYAAERAPRLLGPHPSEVHRALVQRNLSQLRLEGFAAAADLLADGDLLTDVAQLDHPAVVYCGAEDRTTPPEGARQVAAAFPGGRDYVEIPAAGHLPHVEAPDVFNKHLIAFIESLS